MKTKTIKNPLMTAEACGPTSRPSAPAPESKLSRRPEAQYGLVPRLCRHDCKNNKNNISGNIFRNISGNVCTVQRRCFSCFFLDEKESRKGTTVFDGKLVGCLHTSSIAANSVNTLRRVSFSARGF